MKSALVLFSGGQDSATALAWALERYDAVETIGFDYGQEHAVELHARLTLLERYRGFRPIWHERLGIDHWHTLPMPPADPTRGLSSAFIPGRNLVFMLQASILAYQRNIDTIVGGMCETDYRGFPDCRDDALMALQVAVNLGMKARFRFEMPLMQLGKAKTWWLAAEIGSEALVDLIREESHTCYRGDREHVHAWGYGCGHCDACTARAVGWGQFCRELAT